MERTPRRRTIRGADDLQAAGEPVPRARQRVLRSGDRRQGDDIRCRLQQHPADRVSRLAPVLPRRAGGRCNPAALRPRESRRSERLAVEALIDPMTKLSNRRAWDQLLAKEEERCQRYGHAAAVFIIDLDGLKQINDDAGHASGDRLILEAAEAMREVAREVDVVARLGGDEFGVNASRKR